MRLAWRKIIPVLFLTAMAVVLVDIGRAQSPEVMMPEQSAAKAKALLQQAIAALGGQAYLGVRDADCRARLSQFSHNGELTGYETIRDYWKFPDKNRTEYYKKGNIIELFSGNQGWTLDRGGVTEAPAAAIEDFQEQLKKDIDHLLRFRLNEEGMTFRYGGNDITDLKQVEWVEIADRDRRTFRMALDQSTHLPIRAIVQTRNATTRERTEEVNYYSEYFPQQGVQTPFKVARDRDGRKVYEVYYQGCQYNTSLPDDLFTRASLEKRFAEVGKKGKKK